jgi:hypothetical protein
VLHLKGLLVYIVTETKLLFCEKPRLRFLCWHADWTTEKRRQVAALQNVCAGAAACGRIKIGTAGWNYDAGNKKGGREAAALGKTRTLT